MTKLIATTVLLGTILSTGASAQSAQQEQRPGPSQAQAAGQRAGGDPGQDAAPAASVKKLSRAEFDALVKDAGAVLLLDVRRPDELQSIGGFPAYLSIQAAELEKYIAFIPKDRLIVTVSNHANRAQRAAALLEKNGFKVAGAVGAQDYEGEGGTLVKITAPAPRAAGAAAATAQAPGR
jgi:rhodanese-related sulfurtransferase